MPDSRTIIVAHPGQVDVSRLDALERRVNDLHQMLEHTLRIASDERDRLRAEIAVLRGRVHDAEIRAA